jgi:hypothetical protein
LPTTKPTCCLDANPGRRGGKPARHGLDISDAEHSSYTSRQLVSQSYM